MILCIDASNLSTGGGRTHIVELLRNARPREAGFDSVVIWGTPDTLKAIPDQAWLDKVSPSGLRAGGIRRYLWQIAEMPRQCHARQCDLLFVPGGTYWSSPVRVVTMCRNMLPFDWGESRRYGLSLVLLRLLALRWIQARGFKRADGVIFLSNHARFEVERQFGGLRQAVVIPHGVSNRFRQRPRRQRKVHDCNPSQPLRLLYVSTVEPYKHQWNVAEAVSAVRNRTGWPLALDFVGAAYPKAKKRLESCLKRVDQNGEWTKILGAIPNDRLHEYLGQADIGIFASTCENLPNTLIEMMSAGLPIVCSNRAPMTDVLGNGGIYCDPESPTDIARALTSFIQDAEARASAAEQSYAASSCYSWEKCAAQTFDYLARVARPEYSSEALSIGIAD